MRSIVIHAAHDLRVEDRDVEEPGPGQVLIRMAAGGICGSDLHYYHDGGFGAIRLKEPMILGHEVSGFVEKLGGGVDNLAQGQLVAVSPSRPCYSCTYCHEAKFNHCLNMRFYGSAMPFPHIQGAFSQFVVADAVQCAPADGLTPGEAAMAEPLAVCLHAAKQAGNLMGKRVLVTGCGPIGVLCIIAARRGGAAEIVATDLSDFTLGLATKSGADITINMAQNPDALQKYEADKGTFDVMFECTGVVQAVRCGIAAMRPGGVVVQVGLGGDMKLPVQMMTAKELTLHGSFRFHSEFSTGVELMQKKLINVGHLITETVGIADAKKAFDHASDRSSAMKVQIDFQT